MKKEFMCKKKLLIVLILLESIFLVAQTTPPQWFESQYTDALQYCKENKVEMEDALKTCGVPVGEAIAVVFPEMLRYTLWRDLLETKALELLYVRGGSKVADFSIGWFQMKPSFAEQLENEIQNDLILLSKYGELVLSNSGDTAVNAIRKERVQRLKTLNWQLIYLNAFVAINNQRFSTELIHIEKRLSYLAAAYNRGMEKPLDDLESFLQLKTFPYGPGKENPFGYAEIATYYYDNNAKNIFTKP